MRPAGRSLLLLATLILPLAAPGCDEGGGPGPDPEDGYVVPLDPDSPWPKFRRNEVQNGRSPVMPVDNGEEPWVYETDKGIFSTAVIDGEGNVYVGSADRSFYALDARGELLWREVAGEIIDSSALLDDEGRVIYGSGDGTLYARDRVTGELLWEFHAEDPAETGGFINWFEGNVAMGVDGTLYVPNDNFRVYGVDRRTGEEVWSFAPADQTWSLPALNPETGRLFVGNNNLLVDNVFALEASTGLAIWGDATDGSVAASPMLTSTEPDGLAVVGSFDGIVRAYRQDSGELVWETGTRDHVYASPGQLRDGTIVQPSADGTVYALDPEDGSVLWAFDAREPIRSSPAIDGAGNIYVGSGEGKLFVLNPDGTLRWSIRLIDAARDDINSSPALGREGIVVSGENGSINFVPYDYCLRPGLEDDRCSVGGEDLPDGVAFLWATQFGRLVDPPEAIAANQPLAFVLSVREEGDTLLAVIDSEALEVTLTPEAAARVEVSGDRRFLTVVPDPVFADSEGGSIEVRIQGDYLVDLDREGLRFSGGRVGGSFDQTFTFEVAARDGGDLDLPFPAAPGEPAGVFELYRFAAPLPAILPSYNQIGFDSIHYVVGIVEGDAGHAIAWGVGGILEGDDNATVVDPSSNVRFPLELSWDRGLLTFTNRDGFTIEFNGFPLPFDYFVVAAEVDESGQALDSPAINATAVCGDIDFYGAFIQQLGYCNPQTDVINVFGGAELRPYEDGVQEAPEGLGAVEIAVEEDQVVATLTGSTLGAEEHNFGILLVDAETSAPVVVDAVNGTERAGSPAGAIERVALDLPRGFAGEVRAYLMVDAYPAAMAVVEVL